ncbi:bifunctional [glutamine synthetase] adenylyltransferase/[glutamine synthetase]-adenylyl-L-tyrosine phosphorylase [Varibaculum cambriense]|uniref:[glutamate--ammonia-ligase] adenylyltransferase n=1 Tax=Varibaculum cambriense TaxID=184870 RepID=A0AB34WYJ1_9ACTO|nr:bifunctional [glutamine synthetase] adenylyltransferase/[glutamine synthetase]-adenylyl-L-tyrosine phosphorylase [Varibaculum cambriense]KXB80292.1 [glutamate--ammonia-ligase] adenylyltransferase [Varibaculum cambriense]MBS5944465.1 bifunctional [glutamine synthetase] adenylyltransferase/[glutamine synthetase]-adenylyl-L-tyrosine phosphorylase [Varibaculum cambriense]
MARPVTLASRLRSSGVTEVARAESWVNSPVFAPLVENEDFWRELSASAHPDQVLLCLTNLLEAGQNTGKYLAENPRQRALVIAICGVSRFAGDYLVSHPQILSNLQAGEQDAYWDGSRYLVTQELDLVNRYRQRVRQEILQTLGAQQIRADTWVAAQRDLNDLRRAYRSQLLQIIAEDASHPDPLAFFSVVAGKLSALTDATLEGALALARAKYDPAGEVDFAVIALGKTGAEELNYHSDIDLIYVAEPAENSTLSEDEALEVASRLAIGISAACCGPGIEMPLWPIDLALRPEGQDGATCRTVAAHAKYYQKWAKTWEFQALLKARPTAGSPRVADAYMQAVWPLVWTAVEREGFFNDTRAMRIRVEESIPSPTAGRELKLGPGGLRDIEFSVQLLQMVHGRTDESLRVRPTLQALDALAQGGYIGRDSARQLADAYRFLRVVEHRMQMQRMSRTHLFPQNREDERRVGRSLRQERFGKSGELTSYWEKLKLQIRALQQDIFYRPLLPATAGLSKAEAALNPQAAADRLRLAGYRDTRGALGHIAALTSGVSRRSQIQSHILPVLLGWLAEGPSPDAGLLRFRRLSESIGKSHWYMGLLRDSSRVAHRLCSILSLSPYIAQRLEHVPEAVQWLDDDEKLATRSYAQLYAEMEALSRRHQDSSAAIDLIRQTRGRELLRCALRDVVNHLDPISTQAAITVINDATIAAASQVILRELSAKEKNIPRIALVAMGRGGGRESAYASDADLLVVHSALIDPHWSEPGVVASIPAPHLGDTSTHATLLANAKLPAPEASRIAVLFAMRLQEEMNRPAAAPSLKIDYGLRPEGEDGVLSRSLTALRDYYERWAEPWEIQALLRARAFGGDQALIARFTETIDPIRYERPLDEGATRQIRLLKARMENERIPGGQDASLHVKLGPGGLSDVEWVSQLLQLQGAISCPQLRVTGTLEALKVAAEQRMLSDADLTALTEAWKLACRIRCGNVLVTNRMSGNKLDYLPTATAPAYALARLLGYAPGKENDLREDYLRLARRARAVMERVFYNS